MFEASYELQVNFVRGIVDFVSYHLHLKCMKKRFDYGIKAHKAAFWLVILFYSVFTAKQQACWRHIDTIQAVSWKIVI